MFPLIIITIATVSSINAQLNSCPAFVPMSNFNLAQFMGDWAINGLMSPSTDSFSKIKCFHTTFSAEQVDELPVTISAKFEFEIPIARISYQKTTNLTVPNLEEPGKWVVDLGVESTNLFILDTDYDSYSLIAQCHYNVTESGPEFVKASILFASHGNLVHMPMNATKNYLDFIENNYKSFFDISFYQEINHDHSTCHDHDSHGSSDSDSNEEYSYELPSNSR